MSVHVEHGVNQIESESFVGKSVADIRAAMRQPLNIGTTSAAYVNGNAVTEGYVAQEDDRIEFVKSAGSKGRPGKR